VWVLIRFGISWRYDLAWAVIPVHTHTPCLTHRVIVELAFAQRNATRRFVTDTSTALVVCQLIRLILIRAASFISPDSLVRPLSHAFSTPQLRPKDVAAER